MRLTELLKLAKAQESLALKSGEYENPALKASLLPKIVEALQRQHSLVKLELHDIDHAEAQAIYAGIQNIPTLREIVLVDVHAEILNAIKSLFLRDSLTITIDGIDIGHLKNEVTRLLIDLLSAEQARCKIKLRNLNPGPMRTLIDAICENKIAYNRIILNFEHSVAEQHFTQGLQLTKANVEKRKQTIDRSVGEVKQMRTQPPASASSMAASSASVPLLHYPSPESKPTAKPAPTTLTNPVLVAANSAALKAKPAVTAAASSADARGSSATPSALRTFISRPLEFYPPLPTLPTLKPVPPVLTLDDFNAAAKSAATPMSVDVAATPKPLPPPALSNAAALSLVGMHKPPPKNSASLDVESLRDELKKLTNTVEQKRQRVAALKAEKTAAEQLEKDIETAKQLSAALAAQRNQLRNEVGSDDDAESSASQRPHQ